MCERHNGAPHRAYVERGAVRAQEINDEISMSLAVFGKQLIGFPERFCRRGERPAIGSEAHAVPTPEMGLEQTLKRRSPMHQAHSQ